MLKERLLFTRSKECHEDPVELRRRLEEAEKLLGVLDKIDPGFTARRGKYLRVIAKDRMALAKLWQKSGMEGEARKLYKEAMIDLRIMAQCLKHAYT